MAFDLDKLERLLQEATPRPWFWDSYSLIASQSVEPNDPLDQESMCDDCERPFFEHFDFYRQHRSYRICESFRQAERERPWVRVATMGNLPPGGHGDQLHDKRQQAAAELIELAINGLPELIARIRELEFMRA